MVNEFGRLAQGIRDIPGTETIFFIHKHQVPKHKKISYARIVCEIRPQKAEQERTRLTVGGDKLEYEGPVTTDTADITTAKVLFNSVISTENAKFMGIDIKNFYLGTPMMIYEYIKIHISKIPEEIIQKYDLLSKVDDKGWIYIEIRKGMYGLKQAGSNARLKVKLAKHGYFPTRTTPGLSKHQTKPIQFALVVDDFGVKYVGEENAQHLIQALKETYQITIDKEGKIFCGIQLDWDYNNRTVHLSIPGYVQNALQKLDHKPPTRKVHAPSVYVAPAYGKIEQEMKERKFTLTKLQQKMLQKVCGYFLYYARAVDPTMLHALNELATDITRGDEQTMKAMNHFLNYCYTHPDAGIRYQASEMILWLHSDAGYNNSRNARSRVGGHFYLSNKENNHHIDNGAILSIAKLIKNVMASATEAELGAIYVNTREAVPIRNMLTELGHPQPPTVVVTDNAVAEGIINRTVKQQKSKAMDMRYHWIQDRVDQKQFKIKWAPGKVNKGDYHTKKHSTNHHVEVRPTYVQEAQSKY